MSRSRCASTRTELITDRVTKRRVARLFGRGSMTHFDFDMYDRRYRPELERPALRLARDPAEAKDLVQATLERAWRHRGAFAPPGPPRAWLMTVLANLFRDGRKRRTEVPMPRDALRTQLAPGADATSHRDTTPEDALAAVERLPRELRPQRIGRH